MERNLRYTLSNNFSNNLWNDKIVWLGCIAINLLSLHELGYCHKDFHSGNILDYYYLSDFGLSGPPPNEQESDDKIYGVVPIYCSRSFK